MAAHFFKCFTCEQMFVAGRGFDPNTITCPVVNCDIREISEEEAEEIVEEMRNE